MSIVTELLMISVTYLTPRKLLYYTPIRSKKAVSLGPVMGVQIFQGSDSILLSSYRIPLSISLNGGNSHSRKGFATKGKQTLVLR